MPKGPLHYALTRLIAAGQTILARLLPTRAQAPFPPIRPPHPTRADRIATALVWLAALRRVLAGDPFFRLLPSYLLPRFPGRYPALTADLREQCGLPPVPPRTDAQRQASRLHHMRKTFATVPTKIIAARLARRLGLTPAHPEWPAVLLLIEEPPATIGKLWEKEKAQARRGALPPNQAAVFNLKPQWSIKPLPD